MARDIKKFQEMFESSSNEEITKNESDRKHVNYMFFKNLETIKRCIDDMMEMNQDEVDKILVNGHDWASDHIATSKDDIEEVANFLKNEVK